MYYDPAFSAKPPGSSSNPQVLAPGPARPSSISFAPPRRSSSSHRTPVSPTGSLSVRSRTSSLSVSSDLNLLDILMRATRLGADSGSFQSELAQLNPKTQRTRSSSPSGGSVDKTVTPLVNLILPTCAEGCPRCDPDPFSSDDDDFGDYEEELID